LYLSDVSGLVEEIGHLAGIDPRLTLITGSKKGPTASVESLVQLGNEDEGIDGKDLLVPLLDRAENLDAVPNQEGGALLVVHLVSRLLENYSACFLFLYSFYLFAVIPAYL
jgi:hypothetical protein